MASNRNMPSLAALLGLLAVAGFQNRDKIGDLLKGLSGGGDAEPAPAPAPNGGGLGNLGGALGGSRPSLGAAAGGVAGAAGNTATAAPDLGGLLGGLGGLGGLLGAATASNPNVVSGGLGDLLNSFKNAGHGDVADSWVVPGTPIQKPTTNQVEDALGSDTIGQLAQTLGLDRGDLLKTLSQAIPGLVDQLTPNGALPRNEAEARQRLGG